MRISILKLRFTLFIAVAVLFVSMFSNRVTLAKGNAWQVQEITHNNLPAGFVYTTNLSGLTKTVFQRVNLERKRKRLKPLLWHKGLAELSYNYSKQMAREGFFDHYDADGKSVVERADDQKIKGWLKLGENLFQGLGYPKMANVAVKGWLESPTHRANIYDTDWTHTGIGVYKTREDEVFITQVFMKK